MTAPANFLVLLEPPFHPIGARVISTDTGTCGTVKAWQFTGATFSHVVALDEGGRIVADAGELARARPRPGWEHFAVVLEGERP